MKKKFAVKVLDKVIKIKHKIEEKPFCSMVVVAAGASSRMEGTDKLTAPLCGKPALYWTLKAMQECRSVNEIILVTRAERLAEFWQLVDIWNFNKVKKVVKGGESRMESSRRGIDAADEKATLIGIHDGARPLVTAELVSAVIKAANLNGAATAATVETDTVKLVQGDVICQSVDRDSLVRIETPQVFVSELIKAAVHTAIGKGEVLTDETTAVQNIGMNVHVVKSVHSNMKLTTPEDLITANAILEVRKNA